MISIFVLSGKNETDFFWIKYVLAALNANLDGGEMCMCGRIKKNF